MKVIQDDSVVELPNIGQDVLWKYKDNVTENDDDINKVNTYYSGPVEP